jgi:hypothetical protein
LILKGILTADDAAIAAGLGVAAILVSNHGARQVDSTPASVSAAGIFPDFQKVRLYNTVKAYALTKYIRKDKIIVNHGTVPVFSVKD